MHKIQQMFHVSGQDDISNDAINCIDNDGDGYGEGDDCGLNDGACIYSPHIIFITASVSCTTAFES